MTARLAYAWKDDDGKYRLSAIGPRSKLKRRPANIYDTAEQLQIEAAQRGMTVEWESGKPE